MKAELQIPRVESCLEWLEKSAEDYTAKQSIDWFIDQIGVLCASLAFIGGQMAVAKEILNEKKVKAYETLVASSVANETYFAPSLAKDYIASKVSQDQYNYDVCERAGRCLVHTLDCLRTCMSCLREEVKISNYSTTFK
jgi:hypothetical protein